MTPLKLGVASVQGRPDVTPTTNTSQPTLKENDNMASDPADMNAVLDLPMQSNDADAATVREYLAKLAELMWTDGEAADGKRPFGNSGWEPELYAPLVAGGYVQGTLRIDGAYTYVDDCDEQRADRLITQAIRAMGQPPVPPGVEEYRADITRIRADITRARAILAQHDAGAPGQVTPA